MRKQYLEAFIVHQMRSNNAKKTTVTSDKLENKQQDIKQFHMWSKETMDKELGPIKGAWLRASKKIKWYPCSITESEDEDHIEWKVPIVYSKVVAGEINAGMH